MTTRHESLERRSPPGRAGFWAEHGTSISAGRDYSNADPIRAFLDALAQAGIIPTEPNRIVPDGTLVRFGCEGDRGGSRNGWAILSLSPEPWGCFGSWRSGATGSWRASRGPVSPADSDRLRAAVFQAQRQREAERIAGQQVAAEIAVRLWESAGPADPDHPYLRRKRIKPHGLRQAGHLLLVPLRDATGVLMNLQTIDGAGEKRFRRGGRVAGLYCALGGPVTDRICIAEGLATAASILEATGNPTAAAMSAGNLRAVALALSFKYPKAEIIIAADSDPIGIQEAKRAARAVGGRVAFPPEMPA